MKSSLALSSRNHRQNMLKKQSFVFIALFAFLLAISAGCEKASIDLGSGDIPYNPAAPMDSVRFSTDIIPIFNASCVSCHAPGATSPDLTPANAYNNLTALPGQYINLANPASSLLYTYLSETTSSHYGVTTQAEQEKILIWIQQGAKNN